MGNLNKFKIVLCQNKLLESCYVFFTVFLLGLFRIFDLLTLKIVVTDWHAHSTFSYYFLDFLIIDLVHTLNLCQTCNVSNSTTFSVLYVLYYRILLPFYVTMLLNQTQTVYQNRPITV